MAGIVIDVDTKDTNANANLKKMDSALARIIKKARGSKRELDGLASVSLKDTSRSIDKADKEIKDLGKSGTKSFSDVSKGSKEANKSLINLKSTVVTLASSFLALKGLNTFNEMGDNITNVQNKLKLVDNSIKNIMRSQQDLYKVSRQTVSSYSETVDLYYKMRRGLEGTSRGHKAVLEIVKTMNIAAQLSGSSAEATKAAMIQFSQGIAANRLSGQEFNSMAEQMSYAFYGIAKAAGVTAGELRKMAEEGELTVKFVADNILRMSKQANKDWENMQLTASQGLLQFRQSLSYLFGDLNKFYKFTDKFTKRFLILADSVDSFRIKFVTKLETFRLQVTNFITTFDRLTAIRLTWDAFAALDYPIEKFTLLYQHIKRVKDQWEALKASVSDTLSGSREAMVQKLAIKFDSEAFRKEVANAYDKSVDEVNTDDINRYANQHLKTLSTIDRLKLAYGDLFNELGRYFKISFNNFSKLIPNITTPIIQSFKDIESTIAMRAIAFDDKMFKKLKPLRDKLESLVEIVTIFQSGDDRLSRAWSQLFDVGSLKEFVTQWL
jgi:tape measure domain-containing protein